MPRSLYLSLLALVFAAAPVVAAPGVVGGLATAATFTIYGNGLAVEGGGFDWTMACAHCLVRVVFTQSELVFVGPGAGPLGPGAYEFREFTGIIAHRMDAPYDYKMLIAGQGKINCLC